MYQVMMQQITNDRLNQARQQADAHRQALQARVAHQAKTASAVDKGAFRQDSGKVGRLVAAAKQVTVW